MRHRAAAPQDLPGIYRVCFETADPVTQPPASNRDLLGHIYAGPYVVHEPALARVVADDHGVAGYVLGCRDTRAFEALTEREWWPALRRQYPLDGGDASDRSLIAGLHRPPRSPDSVVDGHPAHLHIDLLPRAQGTGLGRELIEWLLAELRRDGAPGVHLGVGTGNVGAIGFYRHLGFTSLRADEHVVWMGMTLA